MTFENLECWQHARHLTREIHTVTRREEIARDFGICSQIQRAAVSTMSNMAEGFERQHIQEKLQFYNVASGSNAEVRSLTYVIEDNYPGLSVAAVQLRDRSIETGKLLSGLIRSTESRKSRIASVLTALLHLFAVT